MRKLWTGQKNKMEENYLKEATNPFQYDSEAVNWKREGLKDSPTRRFFWEYLREHLNVKGKSVLDIGSGMGQLFPLFEEMGALKIQGVEPSSRNIGVSQKIYPNVPVFTGTLAQMPETSFYEIITAIMVFEHIGNLGDAFKKINKLLSEGGRFFLIVADKEYHSTQRFGYKLESQKIGNGEVAIKITRPHGVGVLYDIIRPLQNYIAAAKENNFVLENHVELKPTKNFIKDEPKYVQFKDSPLCHLLIFKKSRSRRINHNKTVKTINNRRGQIFFAT